MDKPTTGQFHLLANRRFLPFFLTQFLGAFNDNVFKNALILLVAFSVLETKSSSDVIINFAAMLFILPFFLFSATAGQLADKMEKSRLIRRIKWLEVAIMGLAAWAFYSESLTGLLAVLFLMGTQSTFFGPVKYSLIPQHLTREELVGGNALVEAGTFIAIILGMIAANVFTSDQSEGFIISIAVVVFSNTCLSTFWETIGIAPPIRKMKFKTGRSYIGLNMTKRIARGQAPANNTASI